ncbi:MAG: hypothetical protein WCT19_02070 [Candidatus Paceibacterota bacterium]|jgi:hypothetical protein
MPYISSIHISIANFDWEIAIIIFTAYFVVDILYAKYTFGVVNYKAHQAALYAVTIYVFVSIGVLSLFTNFLYIIPLACGSYLGTYLTVKREASKREKDTM